MVSLRDLFLDLYFFWYKQLAKDSDQRFLTCSLCWWYKCNYN
jgi:hypothetical protein